MKITSRHVAQTCVIFNNKLDVRWKQPFMLVILLHYGDKILEMSLELFGIFQFLIQTYKNQLLTAKK